MNNGRKRGINAKSKGGRGERELCEHLSSRLSLPQILQRNLEQWRSGGADILGLPGISIEVKRCEVEELPAWWRQTVKAAESTCRSGILAYRRNRQPWRYRIQLSGILPETAGPWEWIECEDDAFFLLLSKMMKDREGV